MTFFFFFFKRLVQIPEVLMKCLRHASAKLPRDTFPFSSFNRVFYSSNYRAWVFFSFVFYFGGGLDCTHLPDLCHPLPT